MEVSPSWNLLHSSSQLCPVPVAGGGPGVAAPGPAGSLLDCVLLQGVLVLHPGVLLLVEQLETGGQSGDEV